MAQDENVNQHYLDRVVALAETSDVHASEDIVSSNGVKLLAKGSRIDGRVRERLLEHKLKQPLESVMQVADGVATRRIDRVADTLLERHGLLARLCGDGMSDLLRTSLRKLTLPPQLDSLLTLYASPSAEKLEHSVGIALLACAMSRDLPGAGLERALMLTAGLAHDVGELYIDPRLLESPGRLSPQEWKHIAAHPVSGARVLTDMPGAGPKVAEAVLHHHERLDGFGYPRGLRGDQVPMAGQVLAMAEMLMGLLEHAQHHALHAEIAVKLIPGEFSRQLLNRIAVASAGTRQAGGDPIREAVEASRVTERFQQVRSALLRLQSGQQAVAGKLQSAPGRALHEHVTERANRIAKALASTGLDQDAESGLLSQWQSFDESLRLEASIVLRELEWRLRELAREAQLRCERLPPAEGQALRDWVLGETSTPVPA